MEKINEWLKDIHCLHVSSLRDYLIKHLIVTLIAMEVAIYRENDNPSFSEQVEDIADTLLWNHSIYQLSTIKEETVNG